MPRIPSDFTLYDQEGWINIPALVSLNCWLYVLIGPRQVGKTYGVLKEMLTQDRSFIFMRRTQEELDECMNNPKLNPFLKMRNEGYDIVCQKTQKTYMIGDSDPDSTKPRISNVRGVGMGLSTIHKVRGFDGSSFDDFVLDECIPEEIAVVRQAEGDAWLNAHTTISGNRELEGKPPLRCWLLANSNRLTSPILMSLELIRPIEKMIKRGDEYTIINGIFIGIFKSHDIVEKRRKTTLMSHLQKQNPKSRFLEMALDNKFSAKETAYVQKMELKGFTPVCKVGINYMYERDDLYYFCGSPHKRTKVYTDSDGDIRRFRLEYPFLKMYYTMGMCRFESAVNMQDFKKFADIKDI